MSSVVFTSSSSLTLFSHINTSKLPSFTPQRVPPNLSYPPFVNARTKLWSKSTAKASINPGNYEIGDASLYWNDEGLQGEEEEIPEDYSESPWEGAIIYKRNPLVSHVEYCTTLERLGMEDVSTEVSKSRASMMGLSVTKAVKDYPSGTPVQVSVDVTRKKRNLRLDGIIKTVLALDCYRCCEPVAESLYINFSLLLTEDPVEEPDFMDFGTIYGDDNLKTSTADNGEMEYDDDASIDWDDRLHFPPQQKEIDISKNIRDLVHIEINVDALCDQDCRGLCLMCGTNRNTSSCNCDADEDVKEVAGHSPLKDLKKLLQSKRRGLMGGEEEW